VRTSIEKLEVCPRRKGRLQATTVVVDMKETVMKKQYCRRVHFYVAAMVFFCGAGVTMGMTVTYKFPLNNCNSVNCPATFSKYGRTVDRFALCNKEKTECRCTAPFGGANCSNWFLEEKNDSLMTAGYIFNYAVLMPIILYLLVGSIVILHRKIVVRNTVSNKESTLILRELSGIKKSWFKRKTGLIVTAAIALCASLFVNLSKFVLDPFFVTAIVGIRTRTFLINLSYGFGFLCFVQLFGAYSKLVLKTKRSKSDAKWFCFSSGRQGIIQRRRFLRRSLIFFILLRQMHNVYANVLVPIHAVRENNSFWAYELTEEVESMLDIFLVFVFTFGTFFQGVKLIREVSSISRQLNMLDLSNATSEDSRRRAKSAAGKRYVFILKSMKNYLLLMTLSGCLAGVLGTIKVFVTGTPALFVIFDALVQLPLALMVFSMMRLLEGRAESEVNQLVCEGFVAFRRACCCCCLADEDAPETESVEVMNVAFGIDTTKLSGPGVACAGVFERQDSLEDFSREELEEDIKLADESHSLRGLELRGASDISPNIP
jgi:hypothetical protein